MRKVERYYSIIRHFPFTDIQEGRNLVSKHVHQFIQRHILLGPDPLLEILNDLHRSVDSHICSHQSFFYRIKKIVIHFRPSHDSPGKPVEETSVGLFYSFVKYTHKTYV